MYLRYFLLMVEFRQYCQEDMLMTLILWNCVYRVGKFIVLCRYCFYYIRAPLGLIQPFLNCPFAIVSIPYCYRFLWLIQSIYLDNVKWYFLYLSKQDCITDWFEFNPRKFSGILLMFVKQCITFVGFV